MHSLLLLLLPWCSYFIRSFTRLAFFFMSTSSYPTSLHCRIFICIWIFRRIFASFFYFFIFFFHSHRDSNCRCWRAIQAKSILNMLVLLSWRISAFSIMVLLSIFLCYFVLLFLRSFFLQLFYLILFIFASLGSALLCSALIRMSRSSTHSPALNSVLLIPYHYKFFGVSFLLTIQRKTLENRVV